MKTLNAFFNRKSGINSINDFEKFAMSSNFMNNVRGGDGVGGMIIVDDDPHDPSTTVNPPKDEDSNP